MVTDCQVLAHSESQALFRRGFLEGAHDVAFWTHIHRVPTVVAGVPQIEVVVVHTHADEVFGAGLLIKVH